MPASNPLRILIVEDNEDLAVSLRGVLDHAFRDRRPEVAIASDCATARSLLRQRAWDLVLSDHSLPDGQGVEVMAEARRLRPAMPLALMTAHPADERLARAARELRLVAFLQKPFPAAKVIDVVQRVLASRRPEPSPPPAPMAPVADASSRSASA